MQKKRFIAGARCPQCQSLDSIVLYQHNGRPRYECVECGYSEEFPEEKSGEPAENEDISVVKFVDVTKP